MKKTLFLFFVLLFSSIQMVLAQSETIRGKVLDDKGDPIAGATIRVKNTAKGTVTDQNGNFRLNIGDGSILSISAIGMKPTDKSAEDGMIIKMVANTQMLGEAVVTALGIKRNKAELGYAAQTVNANDVTATRQNSAINSLSGKVAGLEIKQNNQMGGSSNIVIRGFKSLTGSNQALIVVDGVPYDNSNTNTDDQNQALGGYDYGNAANDINPDDVASINVLKGAAASALYGSRAANGVILIETKKGKKGFSLEINTGASFGFIDKSTFPTYQKEYGAGYGPFYDTLNGGFLSADINEDGVPDLVVPITEDASFGAKFDQNLYVMDWKSIDPTSPSYKKLTPWVAAQNDPYSFFQKPRSGNNGFVLTAGNDKSNYKIGYTRTDDKGMLPNSNLHKNLISFGANHQLNDRFSVGISSNTTVQNAVGRYGTGYDGEESKNPMTNFRQWWQVNVDMKDLKEAYDRNPERNSTWNWGGIGDNRPIFWNNPYFATYKNYENDSRTRVFGTVFGNYKITNWMNILGRVSMDNYNEQQEERVAIGSVALSKYNRYNRVYREFNYDLIANFNKTFSDMFKFTGLLGTNIRKQKIESIDAQTNGGLAIANFYSLSNSKNQLLAPTESYVNRQVNGYFGQANFGFADLVFLDFTGRNDVSSTLAKGNNSYFYPSISLTYLFTNHFAKERAAEWFSYGKLRLNYAEVGNDAPYGVTRDYYTSVTPYNGNTIYSANSTKNEALLKPERTKSKEIGLELAFLKNRILFDVTRYYSLTVNQIIPTDISTATGYSKKYLNAGSISNNGLEMSLTLKPIKAKNVGWDITFNYTRNRNKVESLPEGVDNIQLASLQGGVTINAALGEPYGTIKSQDYVYYQGNRVVDSTTGYWLKTTTSNNIVGNINPKWTGSMRNTLRLGPVNFSFLIDMKKGGSVFLLDQAYGAQTGLYPESVGTNDLGNPVRNTVADGGGVILDGVYEDGRKNTTRVEADYFLGNAKAPSDFVYDASYIKLREITLNFNFPSKWFGQKKVLKGINVGLFGRNLWIIQKNTPYTDPEDGLSSGNIQGYQSGAYPNVKTIGFNVKFSL